MAIGKNVPNIGGWWKEWLLGRIYLVLMICGEKAPNICGHREENPIVAYGKNTPYIGGSWGKCP